MMLKNPLVWLLVAGGVLACLHWLWFVFLPMQGTGSGDPVLRKRRRQFLERVVATPSLFGDHIKVVARLYLLPLYFGEEEFGKLEATCRAILAHDVAPGVESDTRQRLAQSLEAQGRLEEAAEERRKAQRALKLSDKDVLHYLAQGKLLKDQRRFAEAYDAFEQGLGLAEESPPAQRAFLMSEMMLAAFNMGRPDLTVYWAEQAIATDPGGESAPGCHRMAGVALGNLGRFEESQAHWQWAYEHAVAMGDEKVQAECQAMIAGLLRKQGRLADAYTACTQAAQKDTKGIRNLRMVQADVLRCWGRFDEALATLQQAMATPGFKLPSHEQRIQAAAAMEMAQIEAEAGRADEAWQQMQKARPELSNDAKLNLLCEAGTAWILALRGETNSSRSSSEMALSQLPQFEQDRGTILSALSALASAALARGDNEQAQDFARRYLDIGPDPCLKPKGLYQLGSALWNLGDHQGARECFRQACAFDFETHYTQLAQKRLKEAALESL